MAESNNSIKKFGVCSNVLFMLRQAAEAVPSVIWLTVLQALLAVAISLVKLFLAPTILEQLEEHSSLHQLLSSILIFILVLMALQYLHRFIDINKLFGRVEVRSHIIGKISAKKGTCSYPLLEQKDFQDVMGKADNATEGNTKASEAMWETLGGILQNAAGMVIYLLLLTEIHPLILAVTAATTLIYSLIHSRCTKWSIENSKEEGNIWRKIKYLETKRQDRQLGKDLRIFGMAGWLSSLYENSVRALRDFIARREKVYLYSDVANLLLSFLRNGIAYGYLIWITLEGNLSSARFLLYFTAVGGFTGWVSGMVEQLLVLSKQSVEIDAIRTFIGYEEPFRFQGGEPLTPEMGEKYTLELRDVSFRYPGAVEDIFSHLNLRIEPGEKLAIVGLNGAGKTTLIKLLCGFYDPTEGAVLLNGMDIRRYNRRDYYRLFTGVFQDFSVLPGSIALNISQTLEETDYKKVEQSIMLADLKKIGRLPKQYETKLGKEVYEDAIELSGGEIQRLMLARLLYNRRPVVVLDEPTAALDAIAEKALYERYHELTQGCTAIYISHRLASTRFCDRVLLIGDKNIAEEGTHEELLALGGRYARLFKLQSKWYKRGEEAYEGE